MMANSITGKPNFDKDGNLFRSNRQIIVAYLKGESVTILELKRVPPSLIIRLDKKPSTKQLLNNL